MVCEGIGQDPLQCRAAGAGGGAAVGPAVAGERSVVLPKKRGLWAGRGQGGHLTSASYFHVSKCMF